MDFSFSFDDFGTVSEDFEIVKIKRHERGWKFGRGGSILCRALVLNGLIYFGALDGILYCLDPEKRDYKWTFKTGDRIVNSPANFENLIIIPSYDGRVYAVDSESGKEVWQYNEGSEMIAKPTVFEGKVYLTARNGFLAELDAKTGEEIKKKNFGSELSSCPLVKDDVIIFGSQDSNLYCLRRSDFTELWRFKTGNEIFNLLEFPEKDGIVLFASMDSYLYAVRISDGKEVWRFRTGKYGNTTSAVIKDDIVYYGSRDHVFYAIDFGTGREIWRFHTNGTVGGAAVAEFYRNLIFIDSGGELFALTKAGEEVWRHSTQYDISGSTPVIHKEKLYMGMWDCYFYCLDPETGVEFYRIQTSTLETAYLPPANEAFEARVRKHVEEEDWTGTDEDKYTSQNIDMSSDVYSMKSEYAHKSEYKTSSEYK
ncbi:MAG: PQQ-binding-like beta-propeller repeat protein [Candidatus Aenigmarchaeota archaeon]|nr:PQQ-binding-like beta-propeller repeat protein [Candidatus Aenigmarchaeota archaeon]